MSFRFPSIPTAAFALLGALSLTAFANAEESGPAFKPLSLVSSGGLGYDIHVDENKFASITYSGLEVAVMPGSEDPHTPGAVTRVASLVLPVAGGEKGIKLGVNIEGRASLDKDVDASLIATVNGEAHALDFVDLTASNGVVTNGPCDQTSERFTPVPLNTPVESRRKPARDGELDSSFIYCFIFEASTASDLRLNVLLTLSRRDSEGHGYLNVSVVSANVLARSAPPK